MGHSENSARSSSDQETEEIWQPQLTKPLDPAFGYERVFSPWATRRYPLNIHGLHEEILDVYYWLRPTHLETLLRYQVFEKVKAVIEEKWRNLPDLRVSVFGSLRTRLFLPTSDIDVLVEYTGWKDTPADVMEETQKALSEKDGLFKSISVLKDTPVPIIKVVDSDTQINIDISFNTVQGVKAAEYIENVKQEYPVLEPLVLILKQFLSQRKLNLTYNGGLSSYGLILMIQHFLQTNYVQYTRKPINSPDVNLGVLLMRFFEVYALEFNYRGLEILVKEKCYKPRDQETPPRNNLSIEDPLLKGNDVGRSTYNMQQVRQSFEKALVSLRGVFIRDRPNSAIFRTKYPGSIMGHLLMYKHEEIYYRSWLKGYTLSHREPTDTPYLDGGMLLSPPLDYGVLQSLLNPVRKPLKIEKPPEMLNEKISRTSESDKETKLDDTFKDRKKKEDQYSVIQKERSSTSKRTARK